MYQIKISFTKNGLTRVHRNERSFDLPVERLRELFNHSASSYKKLLDTKTRAKIYDGKRD